MQASNASTIFKAEAKTVLVLWLSLGLAGVLCGIAVTVVLAISPKAAPSVVALSTLVALGISLTVILPKETRQAWNHLMRPSVTYLRELPDKLIFRDRAEKYQRRNIKILDSSAIIDGRIADITETGFIDDILIVPEPVLRELEQAAQSSEAGKRRRGLRALDTLVRLKRNTTVFTKETKDEFGSARDMNVALDLALIEMAEVYDAKIITNDLRLNKIAKRHGVEVVNVNDLANALRPIVLPGETMHVFILKEGSEPNQGVAYLDDGTMVVVDNASHVIGKNVEISVTSVLQTTAGKMVFGKAEENFNIREGRSQGMESDQLDLLPPRPIVETNPRTKGGMRMPWDKQ